MATDLSPFLPAHALEVPVPGFKTDPPAFKSTSLALNTEAKCAIVVTYCINMCMLSFNIYIYRAKCNLSTYCTNHAIPTGTTSELRNTTSALCPVLQPRVHSLSHKRFELVELIELVRNKARFGVCFQAALGQETVPTRARSRCAWTLVQSLYQPDRALSGLR